MNQTNVLAVDQQVNKQELNLNELNYCCRVNLSGFVIQISIVSSVSAISLGFSFLTVQILFYSLCLVTGAI
jgi:hypothetical protein